MIEETLAGDRRTSFERIYAAHEWGGSSRSGPGSDPANTRDYVAFMNRWLCAHPEVTSIVEVGCGDWATTSLIELGAARSYLGVDIVQSAVCANTERFGSGRVAFECRDFIASPPPQGDLLLAKDVLQHLSNAAIRKFISDTVSRFRYAIITNDLKKVRLQRLPFGLKIPRKIGAINSDIHDGGSRSIDIGKAPFGLPTVETATYRNVLRNGEEALVYTKQIAVIDVARWKSRIDAARS